METVTVSQCPKNPFFTKTPAAHGKQQEPPIKLSECSVDFLSLPTQDSTVHRRPIRLPIVQNLNSQIIKPSLALSNLELINGLVACIPDRCHQKVHNKDGLPTTLAKMRRQLRRDSIADFVWVLRQPQYQQSYEIPLTFQEPSCSLRLLGPPLSQTAGRILLSQLLEVDLPASTNAYDLFQQFPKLDPREFLGSLLLLALTRVVLDDEEHQLEQAKSLIELHREGQPWSLESLEKKVGVVQLLKQLDIGFDATKSELDLVGLRISKSKEWSEVVGQISYRERAEQYQLPDPRLYSMQQLRAFSWMAMLAEVLHDQSSKIQIPFRTVLRILGLERCSESASEKKLIDFFRINLKDQPLSIGIEESILYFELDVNHKNTADKEVEDCRADSEREDKGPTKPKKAKMQPLNQKLYEAVRKKILTKEEQVEIIDIALREKPDEIKRAMEFLTKKLKQCG